MYRTQAEDRLCENFKTINEHPSQSILQERFYRPDKLALEGELYRSGVDGKVVIHRAQILAMLVSADPVSIFIMYDIECTLEGWCRILYTASSKFSASCGLPKVNSGVLRN